MVNFQLDMKRKLNLANHKDKLQYALTVVVTTAIVILFFQYVLEPYTKVSTYRRVFVKPTKMEYEDGEFTGSVTPKKIVMWTPFFGHKDFFPSNLSTLQCSSNGEFSCQLEIERTRDYATNADAILFHARDVSIDDLPTHRDENSTQLWAMFNYESPSNSEQKVYAHLTNRIDLTISYRLDSDIYAAYGQIGPKSDTDKGSEETLNRTEFENKGFAVWLVSDCKASSLRQDYVKEMLKYVEIDVYGGCGQPAVLCNHMNRLDCYIELSKRYKFYLSFENSLCRDYVTEKFFLPLKSGMIPITLGGADYTQFAPDGSYINALDFENPKMLVEYLRKVATNYNLYSEYFNWKKEYEVYFSDLDDLKSKRWLCILCSYLHKIDKKPVRKEKRKKLVKWWFKESVCWSWSKYTATNILKEAGRRIKDTLTGPAYKMISKT